MAVFTLADLPSRGPASSKMPLHFHRTAQKQRQTFSVADAVHVKLRLQALDKAISSLSPEDHDGSHVQQQMAKAWQPRPSHEAMYLDGSEEFYLLLADVAQPDLIPDVYIGAYRTVLQGQHHVNEHKSQCKGCRVHYLTFSEIRCLLADIDRICDTDLDGAFSRLDDKVPPFAFLRLPAELRLHVYSFLIPRAPEIPLIRPDADPKAPRRRPRLHVMRVSKQLHGEVRKYMYEGRTLFMAVGRDEPCKALSDTYSGHHYEAIASMNPETRQLFQRLEVRVCPYPRWTSEAHRCLAAPTVKDLMRHLFNALSSLETLVISFDPNPARHLPTSLAYQDREDMVRTTEWLIDEIPASIKVEWDQAHSVRLFGSVVEQMLLLALQDRGSKKITETAAAYLRHCFDRDGRIMMMPR
ncbi:hypothetical protein EJ02DRAFT_39784 [Clathrospora elynae]|uniref:F-box domain-containing protein n=1 Tax=Clathrospora elynae TaxID=706981 RepID=A0A6A5SEH5_9PLEO|nr:hypothetical protein EJ02DRAFT_39784 [Clathrospora elynae]